MRIAMSGAVLGTAAFAERLYWDQNGLVRHCVNDETDAKLP